MGCVCTKQSPSPIFGDPFLLSSQTLFTVKEIKSLHELFRKLGTTDGFLNREEFRLGLFGNDVERQSLFGDRMFDVFDCKHDGVLDFGEFVRSLNVFHPDAPQEDKAIFAFNLYDTWNTGYMEKEEVINQLVKEMVTLLLSESDLILPDDIVEAIVDKTFEEVDSNKDGKIDVEEWKCFATRKLSLLRNMTLPYLKDITNYAGYI